MKIIKIVILNQYPFHHLTSSKFYLSVIVPFFLFVITKDNLTYRIAMNINQKKMADSLTVTKLYKTNNSYGF